MTAKIKPPDPLGNAAAGALRARLNLRNPASLAGARRPGAPGYRRCAATSIPWYFSAGYWREVPKSHHSAFHPA